MLSFLSYGIIHDFFGCNCLLSGCDIE